MENSETEFTGQSTENFQLFWVEYEMYQLLISISGTFNLDCLLIQTFADGPVAPPARSGGLDGEDKRTLERRGGGLIHNLEQQPHGIEHQRQRRGPGACGAGWE